MIAKQDKNGNIHVTGNKCERGEVYGTEELMAPKRVVTAVVKTKSLFHPYVSVKTHKAILRKYIGSLLNTLYTMEIEIPVNLGDVIINNFKNTNVDVIATKNILEWGYRFLDILLIELVFMELSGYNIICISKY